MKELEQSGASFEADAAKDNLKDIIGDLASTSLAYVAENLPGVGIIFKIEKTIQSIRDMETMNKALSFLHELSSMSKKQRDNLIQKINKDPIYGQRFGTFMLTAIDRHDFKEKSVFLARACKFYERGDMQKSTFIRIKSMIEYNDLIDLELWMNASRGDIGYTSIKIPRLALDKFISSGILSVKYQFENLKIRSTSRQNEIDGRRVIKSEITPYGKLLLKILLDDEITDTEARRWRLKEYDV